MIETLALSLGKMLASEGIQLLKSTVANYKKKQLEAKVIQQKSVSKGANKEPQKTITIKQVVMPYQIQNDKAKRFKFMSALMDLQRQNPFVKYKLVMHQPQNDTKVLMIDPETAQNANKMTAITNQIKQIERKHGKKVKIITSKRRRIKNRM